MKEVYFDNAATSRCSEGVVRIVNQMMLEAYGNPSSMHGKGVEAEKYCRTAAETLAACLKVSPEEILFTSGGTESNNQAIKGAAYAYQRRGKHLITTQIEHPSVYRVMEGLEKEGFCVTYLPVNNDGLVEAETFQNALRDDTILTSIMTVNNETGARQPVELLAKIQKTQVPGALFHTDAVQGFAKYRLSPAKSGIDLLSISGHKFHGPKGIGALYIRKGVRIVPLLEGGGQQNGLRSGTHPVPLIAGLGQAAAEAYQGFDEKIKHLYTLKKCLTDGLSDMEDVYLLGTQDPKVSAPHIVSAAFVPVRSEVLLHALEEKGIYVSSGSACSSHNTRTSRTVSALGVEKAMADSVIRFSFCENNTTEEVQYCLETLQEILPVLKKYARR